MKKLKNKKIVKVLALTLVMALSFSMFCGFTPAPDYVKYNLCDECTQTTCSDGECTDCTACDPYGTSDMSISADEGIAVADIPNADSIDTGVCVPIASGSTVIDESETDTVDPGTCESISYDIGFATYTYEESDLTSDNEDITVADYSPTINPDNDVTITASVQFPEEADGAIGYMQIYYLGPDDSTFTEYLDTAKTVAAEIDSDTTYTGTHTFEDLEAGMHKVIFKFYSSASDVNAVYTTASTIIVSGTITEMSTIANVTMTSGVDKTVSFTHETNGDLGTLTYTWFLNNEAFEVTSDPEIILNDLSAGIYNMFCQIVPAVGVTVNTNSFTVTVAEGEVEGGITIVSQPSNVQVKEGETAVMSVSLTADDDVELSYVWSINDNEIANSNNATISFKDLKVGTYAISCDVSVDGDYSFTTKEATISVVSADATATTAPDSDSDTSDGEETFLNKAGAWAKENTALALVIVAVAVIGVVHIAKKRY